MKSLLNRLHQMDHLIHQQKTGSPSVLGDKIGVSERSVFDYLKLMKEMGAPIHYSRHKGTYYYQPDGRFNVRFLKQD